MNYDDRISIAQEMVGRFLERYSPPRAMTGDAQAASFEGFCGAVNRRIASNVSADFYRERVKRICEAVADNHDTNAWPVQAEFAKAANKISGSEPSSSGEGYEVDAIALTKTRIANREAIGDEWLYGRLAHELIAAGVPEADLAPYRSSLFFAERKLLGEDEARRMESYRKAFHEAAA